MQLQLYQMIYINCSHNSVHRADKRIIVTCEYRKVRCELLTFSFFLYTRVYKSMNGIREKSFAIIIVTTYVRNVRLIIANSGLP